MAEFVRLQRHGAIALIIVDNPPVNALSQPVRQGLQQAFQASAVGALTAYFLGDVSSLLAAVPAAMMSMRYSREHEREADDRDAGESRRPG